MSDTPADFDLLEQLVRIDRAVSETHKFVAEAPKIAAEASRPGPGAVLSPWLAVAAISGGIGDTIAGATASLRLAGFIH